MFNALSVTLWAVSAAFIHKSHKVIIKKKPRLNRDGAFNIAIVVVLVEYVP